MKKTRELTFNISLTKEEEDTQSLIDIIKKDGWINSSTIIVNCSPEYSSRLSQTLNHQLSSLNKNELFEQMDFSTPYGTYSQVWNNLSKNYENFDTYLKNWIYDNIYPTQFLFVSAGVVGGRELNKLKLSLRGKLENELFRFASLYVQDDSVMTPDYYIQKFNKEQEGGLLFSWENPQNPNWDY